MGKLKILMIVLLVAGMGSIAVGQKMKPEERAAKEVENLSSIVTGISDQQKEELKAVNLKHIKAMNAVRKTSSKSSADEDKTVARQKISALRKEKNEAYKKILTKEQYQRFQEWMAQNQQKSKKGKKGKKEAKPS